MNRHDKLKPSDERHAILYKIENIQNKLVEIDSDLDIVIDYVDYRRDLIKKLEAVGEKEL